MEPNRITAARRAQANEALFRNIIAVFGRADIESILERFAEDCIYIEMNRAGHRVEGRAAFRTSLTEYFRAFDMTDAKITFLALVANPTHVCGEFETTARYVGPGASPEGDVMTWTATVLDRVEGELVKEEHVYVDARAAR